MLDVDANISSELGALASRPRTEGETQATVLWATSGLQTFDACSDLPRALVELRRARLEILNITRPECGDAPGGDATVFVHQVAECAQAQDAGLIVVSAHEQSAHSACALVSATGVPVLVVRPRIASGGILAATDLGHPELPVLRHARYLARVLKTTVVALHNVAPRGLEIDGEQVSRSFGDREATSRQLSLLLRATRVLHVANAVLTSVADPLDAVLAEARRRDSSLIVVGLRTLDRPARRMALPSELVNACRRSILIVPIEPQAATTADGLGAPLRDADAARLPVGHAEGGSIEHE